MSRWHDADCYAPKIKLRDDVPFCEACGMSPPLREMIACATQANLFPHVPHNEPPDQMNLHWPSCARYSKRQEPVGNEAASSGTADFGLALPTANAGPPSLVYKPALKHDQFRLLRLSCVNDDHHPIHGELETYPDDDCPEYETVSYLWGGENGDARQRHPIFLGPYWDVLLQTENCHDMLRYLRPNRGIRLVWVDAICINQDDDQERGHQVSKMATIYKTCSRVVVYLGSDIITPPAGRHPRRKGLHQLRLIGEQEDGPTLHQVLSRRYFSRVWVIQELILPQGILIRIRDTDYISNGLTTSQIDPTWKWEASPAPWLQHLSTGGLSRLDLLDVMSITSDSISTDPRDQIFGIFGLLFPARPSGPPGEDTCLYGAVPVLEADYSLSPQHVYIGVSAYSITCLKRFDLLFSSCGICSPEERNPSWVPNWRARGSLLRMDTKLIKGKIREFTALHGQLHKNLKRHMHHSAKLVSLETWDPDDTIDCMVNFSFGPEVDPTNGALMLKLIHLLPFDTVPRRLEHRDSVTVFELGDSLYRILIFAPRDAPLDSMILPHLDSLFILQRDKNEYLPLILRRSAEEPSRGPEKWRMVAACLHVAIAYSPGENLTTDNTSFYNFWDVAAVSTLHFPVENAIRASPITAAFQNLREKPHSSQRYLRQLLGGGGDFPTNASIYLLDALCQELTGKRPDAFAQELLKLADPAARLETDGPTLKMTWNFEAPDTKSSMDWGRIRSLYEENSGLHDPEWVLTVEGNANPLRLDDIARSRGKAKGLQTKRLRLHRHLPWEDIMCGTFGYRIEASVNMEKIKICLSATTQFRLVWEYNRSAWGNIWDVIEKGPHPLDKWKSAPRWPRPFVDQFKISGDAMEIWIV